MRSLQILSLAALCSMLPAAAQSAGRAPAQRTSASTRHAPRLALGARVAIFTAGATLTASGVHSLLQGDGRMALPQLAAGGNLLLTSFRKPTKANLAQGATTTALATVGAALAGSELDALFQGGLTELQAILGLAKADAGSIVTVAATAANLRPAAEAKP